MKRVKWHMFKEHKLQHSCAPPKVAGLFREEATLLFFFSEKYPNNNSIT